MSSLPPLLQGSCVFIGLLPNVLFEEIKISLKNSLVDGRVLNGKIGKANDTIKVFLYR